MQFDIMHLLAAVVAGLGSVLSPCVLPVIPIIVTPTDDSHRLRPVMLVAGLALSFCVMGVISSLFGGLIAGKMIMLEKIAGVIIILFGLLVLLDVNLFKKLSFLSRLNVNTQGLWGGFLLGATLGVIWIPCIGPILSSILALVATQGSVFSGVVLLGFYSLGFAIPMLLLAYSSQGLVQKWKGLSQHPVAIRIFSGGLLVIFGGYIFFHGALIL